MSLFYMTVKTFILYGVSRPKMSQGHIGHLVYLELQQYVGLLQYC